MRQNKMEKYIAKIGKERVYFKDFWVYDKETYPHMKKILTVVRNYNPVEDSGLQKIENYIKCMPAKFFTIICVKKNQKRVKIGTCSVNIINLFQIIGPIFDLWQANMIDFEFNSVEEL